MRTSPARTLRHVLFALAVANAASAAGWVENESAAFDCDPAASSGAARDDCLEARAEEGRRLFDEETFDGNGRTCLTCHSIRTGTIDPKAVRKRLRKDPGDPLFVHDGLDDFFAGTSRIETHATVLIERELTEHVVLADDPDATSIVVPRGVPTTLNTPALDPALMYDLRDPDLQTQALGAIRGHAQNGVDPTPLQLDLIAEFQQQDKDFFSNPALRRFAAGGPAPVLPEGETASEKRGREFFVDAPWDPPSKKGACALCHSGAMLNTANQFTTDATGAPPGWRAFDILVNARNELGRPVHTFEVGGEGCDDTFVVQSPDPGVLLPGVYDIPLLAQFLPPEELCILHPAFFANMFKTPTLWGAKKTAPYFHDNSAKTLEEVMEQYIFMFEANIGFPITDSNILLTEQDVEDIIAFLKLL